MKNLILLAAAGGAALTALSIDTGWASERQLRYAPAELTSASGALNVYNRIHELAEEVCGDQYGGPKLVKYRAARDRCVADTIESLVEEVGDSRLRELHATYHNA